MKDTKGNKKSANAKVNGPYSRHDAKGQTPGQTGTSTGAKSSKVPQKGLMPLLSVSVSLSVCMVTDLRSASVQVSRPPLFSFPGPSPSKGKEAARNVDASSPVITKFAVTNKGKVTISPFREASSCYRRLTSYCLQRTIGCGLRSMNHTLRYIESFCTSR